MDLFNKFIDLLYLERGVLQHLENPLGYVTGLCNEAKSSTIDILNDNTSKGDNRFHRYEYWGIGSYFFMHYVGDCTILEGFCHRNSKDNTKPFIRSAPHVKGKVSEAN